MYLWAGICPSLQMQTFPLDANPSLLADPAGYRAPGCRHLWKQTHLEVDPLKADPPYRETPPRRQTPRCRPPVMHAKPTPNPPTPTQPLCGQANTCKNIRILSSWHYKFNFKVDISPRSTDCRHQYHMWDHRKVWIYVWTKRYTSNSGFLQTRQNWQILRCVCNVHMLARDVFDIAKRPC